MPETRLQKLLFVLTMSFAMVSAMCMYNALLHIGASSSPLSVASSVASELWYLWPVAIILESLFALPIMNAVATRLTRWSWHQVLRTIATALANASIMCPLMSTIQYLINNGDLSGILPALTLAVLVNFPVALAWQLLVAGPGIRFAFAKLKHRRDVANAKA